MIELIRESLAGYYLIIKFFHLFFVMVWAMSAVGAYLFYLRPLIYKFQETPEDKDLEERLVWAYEQFDYTVILEHIAFPIILITGVLMYIAAGWNLDSHWLLLKLIIVAGIFIPMEIIDIWIAHYKGPRISEEMKDDPDAWNNARAIHWKFLRLTSPLVRFTAPTVVFLAVVKPSF